MLLRAPLSPAQSLSRWTVSVNGAFCLAYSIPNSWKSFHVPSDALQPQSVIFRRMCSTFGKVSQHVADVACPLPSILVPLCSCTPTVFCTPFFSRHLGSVSSSCSDSHQHLSSLCCASPPLSLPAGVAIVFLSDKCKASAVLTECDWIVHDTRISP